MQTDSETASAPPGSMHPAGSASRPTTEEVNAEWEAMKRARRECPDLDYFYKLWNQRANLYHRIDRLSDEMKSLAAEIPEHYRRHLP